MHRLSVAIRVAAIAVVAAVLVGNAFGQTPQAIRITTAQNVAASGPVTTPEQAVPFTSGVVNLNCTSTPTVKLSSTADGSGNVFSDNFVALTVGTTRTPNVCTGGVSDTSGNTVSPDCFQDAWHSSAGQFLGQNPDGAIAATYGVPPLDLSSYFANATGSIPVKIEAMDWGGDLGSSSMYLIVSGCTGTVIGPGTDQQSFVFNDTSGQHVEFDANWTNATTTASGTIPTVTDLGIDPSVWPTYVTNTPFANTKCIPHSGELDGAGNPLCKLYTLTCTTDSNSTPSGTSCPQSSVRNLLFTDKFDASPGGEALLSGLTPGKGIGFLMGSDAWTPGSCVLTGPEASFLCPQNTLTAFSDFSSGGTTRTTNSSFIVVTEVPLPTTTVTSVSPTPVLDANNTAWVPGTFTVNFHSVPATDSVGGTFSPAGISTLTAGISLANNVPDTTFPVAGDTIRTNTTNPCPPGNPAPTTAFDSSVPFTVTSDGQYAVHYFATDCAATEELLFNVSNLTNTSNWVSFKTYPINVDSTAPTATITTPANGGYYALNQSVLASYSCSDSGSGVPAANCVGSVANGAAIDTSTAGQKTFTVNAKDLVGNTGSATSTYNVVGAADLLLRKHAPTSIKTGSNITYLMGTINLGPSTANQITVTDPLPPNTSFVSAIWKQVSCTYSSGDINCSVSSGTACSLNTSNAVVCSIPRLAKFTTSNPVGVGIKLVLQVNAAAGTTLSNTATVSAANADPKPSNNTSTATTKVTN